MSYGLIYNLKLVELETLKTYIRTDLKTGFIWSFKVPIDKPIFFNRKPDRSFHFCVNYQGLNNLTIQNWYSLPLIYKALSRLDQANLFTQLNLINTYYKMRI